jgi:hypothetical protein
MNVALKRRALLQCHCAQTEQPCSTIPELTWNPTSEPDMTCVMYGREYGLNHLHHLSGSSGGVLTVSCHAQTPSPNTSH